MFKVSIDLAKFADVTIFELRKTEATEVLYLYSRISGWENRDETPAPNTSVRRRRFADEVDWFN